MSIELAKQLDADQQILFYRDEFLFPQTESGDDYVYMCGNSLGLQPKQTKEFIDQELKDWAQLGVEGHFEAKNPWMPYHEFVTESLARLVGAKTREVVAMNSLTVNLHLLMVSFYRPTKQRYKILIEGGAFPSDQYAVYSQAKFHAKYLGFDPEDAILEIQPREGETWMRTEDICGLMDEHKDEIALVMLGGVNYLNGQFFEAEPLCKKAHEIGALFGLDLAHAAGNVPLSLHDWGVDFASWCSYKYMNSGPGGISGVYIHESHYEQNTSISRFEGWWGHDKKTRFEMPGRFVPMDSAEAWQMSNPPIFQLAALKSSLEIFDRADIQRLRERSLRLTRFLEELLLPLSHIKIFTPSEPHLRGSQLSLLIDGVSKEGIKLLRSKGVICDFREPNIIRVAPTALYNSFEDCYKLAAVLKDLGDLS